MGRKGKWLSSVKKALTPESKEKKDQKKKWFGGKQRQADSASAEVESAVTYSPPLRPPPSPPSPPPQPEEVNLIENLNETAQDDAVPASAAVSDEPSFVPVETYEVETHEVVRVATVSKYAGMSREEVGAIKIQTAFRGHQARRALRALRGLVRLKLLMEGNTVKRQATHTLRCMQTLSRVQSQITSRRIRMSEEKQALQRQLLQKHAKELESLRLGEEWDDSHQSKEQVEAGLLGKYEAAMRRERALAYSFSHQKTWKNSSKSANPMFMNPNNPTWGWSWLERWMAAHPWESKNMADRESNDQSSVKSAGRGISKAEITKSFARYQINSDKLSPADSEKPNQTTNVHSPSTPRQATSVARKLKSASPRTSIAAADDDSKSMVSMQSDKPRRHSIAGSSVQDDESLGSSPSLPSYMVPTQSAKAKSRFQSPSSGEKNGTQEKEKGSSGPAKKRLSYPPSPAASLKPRSELVKLETNLGAENSISNGDGAQVNYSNTHQGPREALH